MIDLKGLKSEIEKILSEYFDSNNLDLVELKLFFQSGRINIRFLVDYKNAGITLDKCAQANQDIAQVLEGSNLIDASYVIDVSSPGLDRPLKNQGDFHRAMGQDLDVYFSHQLNDKLQLSGKLVGVNSEGIILESDNEKVNIKYEDISKAKQKI